MCDVDWWLCGRVSALHSVVAGSISSRGDHGIHCWWDLIRSKQLSNVSMCHVQIFAGFSGHGNTILYIIPQLKKENVQQKFRLLKKIMNQRFILFYRNLFRKVIILIPPPLQTNSGWFQSQTSVNKYTTIPETEWYYIKMKTIIIYLVVYRFCSYWTILKIANLH